MKKYTWSKKNLKKWYNDAWQTHFKNNEQVSALAQFILNSGSEADSTKLVAIAHTCDDRAFYSDDFISDLWHNYQYEKKLLKRSK